MKAHLKVTACILPDGQPFTCRGQEAKTLVLLHQKGAAGVQRYGCRGGPRLRLPAHCHSLIKRKGLHIETQRVTHDGGWHGRFVLHTPIEIIGTSDPAMPQVLQVAA